MAVVAMGCIASGAASASPVLYGEVHLSINKIDELNGGELRMDSHHSVVGVKGSEDLAHGVKMIYKAEFGFDTSEGNGSDGDPATQEESSFSDRDQWVGIASRELGVLRVGTISTSYKSSGARLDPLYRTVFEQRGLLGIQSALHDGRGVNGGRSTNTIRFDSAEMSGARFVANYSLGEMTGNTAGLGFHYERGGSKFNVDYLDSDSLNATAYKLGVAQQFASGLGVAVQYEVADEVLFDSVLPAELVEPEGVIDSVYNVGLNYTTGNSAWIVGYGVQSNYSSAYYLAFDHKLSERSEIYLGYGAKSFDRSEVKSDSMFAFGVRHQF